MTIAVDLGRKATKTNKQTELSSSRSSFLIQNHGSYLSYLWMLCRPSCLAERNHLCKFGRVHYGEHSRENISNQEEMSFKGNVYGRRTTDGR